MASCQGLQSLQVPLKYYAENGFKTDAVSERVIGWDRAVMSEFNSRPAPEAPNSALGSFEGNPYCEFQDGSSDSPSDCRLRLCCTVAQGIPEPQGSLGSSSGCNRYKSLFFRIFSILVGISHLVMEGPTVQLKDTRVVGKFSRSDFQVVGQASRHRRGSDRSGFYDMTLSPSV
jgi:hypothetical protein